MWQRDRFWEQLDLVSTFALTNLFWIVVSIPLITMPLATVGLFQVMSKWVRGKQPEFFQDFFGAIRQHWASAFMIGLIDVVGGGIVWVNLRILAMMDGANAIAIVSRSTTVLAGLVLLLANLYMWSLLVVAELPLRRIVKMSFQLVLAHPLWSSRVLLAAIIPFLVSLVLPTIVMLFGTVSLSAWIINRGTWHIIRRYLPEDELDNLETKHIL